MSCEHDHKTDHDDDSDKDDDHSRQEEKKTKKNRQPNYLAPALSSLDNKPHPLNSALLRRQTLFSS